MRTTYRKTVNGFELYVDDLKLSPMFTIATGEASMQKLCKVIEPNAEQLKRAQLARNEKQQWNIDNFPNGRNWPEFSNFEKLFTSLQKQAKIKDT